MSKHQGAWLWLFTDVPKLRNLNLVESFITDEGLKYIAKLRHIQTLELADCQNITDTGIKFISILNERNVLNLESCENITDNSLQYMAYFFLNRSKSDRKRKNNTQRTSQTNRYFRSQYPGTQWLSSIYQKRNQSTSKRIYKM